jgi:hypothetical protein
MLTRGRAQTEHVRSPHDATTASHRCCKHNRGDDTTRKPSGDAPLEAWQNRHSNISGTLRGQTDKSGDYMLFACTDSSDNSSR